MFVQLVLTVAGGAGFEVIPHSIFNLILCQQEYKSVKKLLSCIPESYDDDVLFSFPCTGKTCLIPRKGETNICVDCQHMF